MTLSTVPQEYWKSLKALSGIYFISMAVSWICLWSFINFSGMGLTISNAIDAAQQLSRYSPQSRIIQRVNFKYGNLIDIMNSNLKESFGNVWYYKRCVDALKQSEVLQNSLNGKYLFTTLIPLLDIYYSGQEVKDLPVRTILLNYCAGCQKRSLTVTVYPEGVIPE